MGVLNVTPDSFSDGGAYADARAAIAHGRAMAAAGADIIDVGGESTRPGAPRVGADVERERVVPVVAALAAEGYFVSIDTMRASTAAAAIDAGARMVNDVSGGCADPDLPALVAERGTPYVVMHWRAHSRDMQQHAVYGDVVAEVRAELAAQLERVLAAGVDREQVVLDPGLGFAKDAGHNWALLAHLEVLHELGRPLLVGASRKSFLGTLLGDGERPRPVDAREHATTAITALAAAAGVWCVRVHEVGPSADAVRVVAAMTAAR